MQTYLTRFGCCDSAVSRYLRYSEEREKERNKSKSRHCRSCKRDSELIGRTRGEFPSAWMPAFIYPRKSSCSESIYAEYVFNDNGPLRDDREPWSNKRPDETL